MKMSSLQIARVLLTVLVTVLLLAAESGAAQTKTAAKASPRKLDIARRTWTGDFDTMFERRSIRVLVPYSRTLYFNDKGRERGMAAENVRDFENWINKKYAKKLGKRPITIYIVPVTRDKLLSEVVSGLGDIAAGNLTATTERLKSVDFVVPTDRPDTKELVVTGPKSPAIAKADDLSGKTVHVRKASSYYESLEALNTRFKKEGRALIRIVLVPDALEDEDMMEMLNAGLIGTIIVDDWKARLWAQVLPKIRVNENAVVREGGRIGWAVRKKSPKLQAEIQDFLKGYLQKEGIVTQRLRQYQARIKEIKDPTGSEEWKRFEQTLALFDKYGHQYNFDPLMLAAQGFQESRLNQKAKSRVGAVGVMQLMPATGGQMKVGDIQVTEPNIHAGAKYMDQLMTKYFSDAKFDENNRSLFAFASYNAGPGNIAKMRAEAKKQGFDPDVWFNNVEVVTAKKIGIETTTYVRNIYKYYVTYRLQRELHETVEKARKQVAPR